MFPGCLSAGENEDNFNVIEWLAAQPFSSGRVGQYGQSYGGMASLRVASLHPPHLVAIAPQESYASYYRHAARPGGILPGPGRGWAGGVPAYTNGRVTAEFQQLLWAVHPLIDEFWRQIDIDTKYDDISVPTLCFGGWFDIFKEGMVENFNGLANHAYLVMGPWTHGLPEEMADEPAPRGLLLAWFDRFLGGLDAPLPSARVTSYEVPRATSSGWREFDALPPREARVERLHFDRDGWLRASPGAAGAETYEVDPRDGPAAVVSGPTPLLPDDEGVDVAATDDRRLHFETEPLAHDVVIIGPVPVLLRAQFTASDGNIVVKLMDVAADGRVREATVGYLRASHREGHDRLVDVSPGTVADYRVTCQPVHWRFGAGHRLRISVTSGDVPAIAADAPPGVVTVRTGAGGSYVELAVLGDASVRA
jgi:hypothetical protein